MLYNMATTIELVLIAHNLRSAHNVGSLLRTADGLGVSQVYMTGYTPYPELVGDTRLPHLSHRLTKQIHKTALGAETMVDCRHSDLIEPVLRRLRQRGFTVVALEQTPTAQPLQTFKPPAKLALIVGREVDGLEPEVLMQVDQTVFIPMFGKKESFNVTVAAAIALYHCRYC